MLAEILFPINANAFTYLVPGQIKSSIKKGQLVTVPFKSSYKTGMVIGLSHSSSAHSNIVLKPVREILDHNTVIPDNLIKLVKWTGQYYMSTFGLALKNAVPQHLFKGGKAGKSRITYVSEIKKPKRFTLTHEQYRSVKDINRARNGVFLLHGVTGSGKTEVYIQTIKALPANTEAIILVPEIAITSQMIDNFRSHFKDKVVFYHSGISTGEKITSWQKMRNGEVKVVLGVRSAVFAPFKKLGLIIIDEEQETSYKQFEGLRYSARDVALARAKIEDIKVVLGSATPSLETFYNASTGKFKYLQLSHRIDHKPLPEVEVIDMSKEDKKTSLFSDKLLKNLKETVSKGKQSLIMLNRRGYSPFLMCPDCGYSYKCPACSITLTYHKDTGNLKCHYCGSYLIPKTQCPKCSGTKVKYLGAGTQKVEEDLLALIPELSLQRMDRDTTRRKLSHYRIVKQMEEKKLDVLMGTQMVAKGHDFPDVTLSAIVSADVALNLPDFRSGERAFQLFTQLAGRAGRGDMPGKTYIQTYEPEHYVFDYVRNHDYNGFFHKEINLRKELLYPPFSRLTRIILSFRNKESAKQTVNIISGRLKKLDSRGIEVLGPAPAPVEKIRNLWRWHLILKGRGAKTIRQTAHDILETIKDIKGIKVDVDVDPINLL